MTGINILAVDLSLQATGVCLSDGTTDTIAVKTVGAERLYAIRQAIVDLMRWHKPEVIVLEGYSYHSKGRATVSIGELGGVIRLAIWEHDIPCIEVPPTNLKQYATGKGQCPKDDVLQQAVHRSGRVFGDDNQADAWWLHQMALAHYDPESPLLVKMPAVHQKGLVKVPWVEPEEPNPLVDHLRARGG